MSGKKSNTNKKTKKRKENYTDISNVNGEITNEEFANEFFDYPVGRDVGDAGFLYSFSGAELEDINSAKNVKDEVKR